LEPITSVVHQYYTPVINANKKILCVINPFWNLYIHEFWIQEEKIQLVGHAVKMIVLYQISSPRKFGTKNNMFMYTVYRSFFNFTMYCYFVVPKVMLLLTVALKRVKEQLH